jgi:3-deoxy-D-manno-octulosonic-acid transferase
VYFLYSFSTLLAVVALSPYFLYQGLRHKKYFGSARQRLTGPPPSLNPARDDSIWVHAVSVGEVLAARPVIAELKGRYPSLRIFLSTTTITGQRIAGTLTPSIDGVFYVPFDWAFAVRRTLRRVRPRLFVMVETEIWPNILRECRRQGVRTVLINGRLSARSYRRFRLVRRLFGRVLADVERFCVQSDDTRRRLVALGADVGRITVTGSLKFDALEPPETRPHLDGGFRPFRINPARQVLVAGSTLRGEEQAMLRAFDAMRASQGGMRPLLVLAPRHPERFDEVEQLCRARDLVTVRRTNLSFDREPDADVIVLDTIGELAQVYGIATVVFVGGSLVSAGGHNILEPAVHGKPIVVGPHMENFAEIAAAFLAHEALVQVRHEGELDEALASLLGDPVRRARLGAAARALVHASRGATDKTLTVINELLPRQDRRAIVRPFRVVH